MYAYITVPLPPATHPLHLPSILIGCDQETKLRQLQRESKPTKQRIFNELVKIGFDEYISKVLPGLLSRSQQSGSILSNISRQKTASFAKHP